jgi:hypothetical protein
VGVAPKGALAFARAFRAHRLALAHGGTAADFLGFSDKRTTKRFLVRSQTQPDNSRDLAPLEAFCRRQAYLSNDRVIDEVVRILRARQG